MQKHRDFFMVRRKGFEPPTYWFVASYSIQLSYRRLSFGDSDIIAHSQRFVNPFSEKNFSGQCPMFRKRNGAV